MTDAPVAQSAVKPRLPRGFVDRGPDEIAAIARMIETIRSVYDLYGFEPVETPLIEFSDVLGKFLPDQDRPNEGVFSLRDDDEQWLSLRYDLTAPLARHVAENYDRLPKPYRSYRVGAVFRNEKPGPGRFRQFMQFDADTVGAAGVAADAEMCMMAADCMERLGIARGDYVIKVNNRKILDGLMEAIGLGGPENVGRRLVALRAMDKFDKFGVEGVRMLLGAGRRDESGDFTKGAELSANECEPLLRLLDFDRVYDAIQRNKYEEVDTNYPNPFTNPPSGWNCEAYGDTDRMLRKLQEVQPLNPTNKTYQYSFGIDVLGEIAFLFEMNEILIEGIRELAELDSIVRESGFTDEQILISPSIVRGLEYYTGPVFEAELTVQAHGEDGRPIRFGSVGGGGRYDGLVGRFRGDAVPATGFSIGLSRLFSALQAVGSPILKEGARRGPVVVLVLDKDRVAHYQALVGRLRHAGIAAELYLGAAGMNAQLKYADRRRSVCAIIQGSNERDHADGPQVMIRDLVLGAELAAGSKDREDYLELRGRAQFPVPEARLVDAVLEVLGRHGAAPV